MAFIHLPRFCGTAPGRASASSTASVYRIINVAHVRFAEYHRQAKELRIEYSNGDVRSFLNVDESVLGQFENNEIPVDATRLSPLNHTDDTLTACRP